MKVTSAMTPDAPHPPTPLLLAFPAGGVLAHGIDLVEVGRVARMLDRHGARFLDYCFTAGEQAHGRGTRRYAEHLAARLAAKEAVFKALGTGWGAGVGWRDAEVVADGTGRPTLRLHGAAAERALGQGLKTWAISLTHAAGLASASVIATG